MEELRVIGHELVLVEVAWRVLLLQVQPLHTEVEARLWLVVVVVEVCHRYHGDLFQLGREAPCAGLTVELDEEIEVDSLGFERVRVFL